MRLKLLSDEERDIRGKWAALRDERLRLLGLARHAGVDAPTLADATGLSRSRVYNIARTYTGELGNLPDDALEQLRKISDQMQDYDATATILAQRKEAVAAELYHAGVTAGYLANMLGLSAATVRNWFLPKN